MILLILNDEVAKTGFPIIKVCFRAGFPSSGQAIVVTAAADDGRGGGAVVLGVVGGIARQHLVETAVTAQELCAESDVIVTPVLIN